MFGTGSADVWNELSSACITDLLVSGRQRFWSMDCFALKTAGALAVYEHQRLQMGMLCHHQLTSWLRGTKSSLNTPKFFEADVKRCAVLKATGNQGDP